MRAALIACAMLAGCASVPPDVERISDGVHQRVAYKHYAKRDYTYIRPGTQGSGNCAVFAYTAWVDAVSAGHEAKVSECLLTTGEAHAFTVVDGQWVIDVRHKKPVPVGWNGCQG